jgi:hypothetical protein
MPIHGVTQEVVRSTTEDSLGNAADMLDLHLASIVPAISLVRNAYHLWRGNTEEMEMRRLMLVLALAGVSACTHPTP